jgi:chromosome segregation ATPase
MDEIALQALIQGVIGEAVRPLRAQIEALENRVEELEPQVGNKADEDHYHDEYAIADYVDREKVHIDAQLYRLREDISNVEYRVNDAQRAAERAQRAAEDAQRNIGKGYY